MVDQTTETKQFGERIIPDNTTWNDGITQVQKGGFSATVGAFFSALKAWPPHLAAFILIACWAMMPSVDMDIYRLIVTLTCLVCIFVLWMESCFKKRKINTYVEKEKHEFEQNVSPIESGPG